MRPRKFQQRYLTEKALNLLPKKVKRRKEIKDWIAKQDKRRGSKAKNKGKRFSAVFSSLKTNVSYDQNIRHILDSADKLKLSKHKVRSDGKKYFGGSLEQSRVYQIPEVFSLNDRPTESFGFVLALFNALHEQSSKVIILDYAKCTRIDLDAQVLMDVILKGFFDYQRQCRKVGKRVLVERIQPRNFSHPNIIEILFSIGSFKIFGGLEVSFDNIIPYHLCTGDKKLNGSDRDRASQKEIHTTELLDYVILCLQRMGRKMTPEARSELCQVVGEILINAEEHSTTDKRYSIGYFKETKDQGNHFGIFNLVIFNFGMTIYEKFKDPTCPTEHIVRRMKELSDQYTKRNLWNSAEFIEETLWTLYALQEGITSKVNYKKRGNGSIRFIESFFNLKGIQLLKDNVSKLTIHSGNTKITFDGSYEIIDKTVGLNKFKVIAFNNSGNIEERPDKNCVTFVPDYFPGTMIAATIRIGEEDLVQGRAVIRAENAEFNV